MPRARAASQARISSQWLVITVFLAPAVLLLAISLLYPLISSLRLSLVDWWRRDARRTDRADARAARMPRVRRARLRAAAPALLAGYSFPVHLINAGEQSAASIGTPLQALRALLGDERVIHAGGCDIITERRAGAPVFPGDVSLDTISAANRDELISRDTAHIAAAVDAAREAGVAIVFVGDLAGLFQSGTVDEGSDTDSLDLPGVQQTLLSAVVDSGTPTVVVMTGGRPYSLGGLEDRIAAQIMAFAPGERGGEALADLLAGRANFSARLPLSVPKSAGAVPYTYNHRLKSAVTPVAYHFGCRYPFGFGLSDTQFRYSRLAVAQREVPIGDGTVELSFTVENVGAREGTEVVQIYVRDLLASSARPVRELKAFARVPLAAGGSAQVRVRIPVDMLNFTDGREERIVEPGDFELMVGSSSRDIHLSDTVSVTGQAVRTLERDWRMVSEVEVVS